MRSPDWKETAELIGLFAILASLIFVAMQLQQQEELLDLEMRNSMVSNYIAVNEKIIDNADIWVRGNAGEHLDATESVIYESLLTNFNDYHFQLFSIFHQLYPESEEQVLAMYAGFLSRNPGAYQVWIDRERLLNSDRITLNPKETITAEWIDMIESRVSIIKSTSPTQTP